MSRVIRYPGHPGKLIDYEPRAVHDMTGKAKAIVAAYYGVPAKHSYSIGCSLGGMQAAHYEGTGDLDDAENFVRAEPKR
jgi:hypothetical protein